MNVLVLFLLILTSCAHTTQYVTWENPPIVVDTLFQSCAERDGALRIDARHKGTYLGGADLEWIVSQKDGLRAELQGPVAQILARIRMTHSEVSADGVLNDAAQNIKIKENGFLEYDGHFVPMRLSELGCFLGFSLPRDWLQKLVSHSREDSRTYTALVQDKKRSISLRVDLAESGKVKGMCAHFYWSSLWGLFGHNARLCYDPGSKRQANLVLANDFDLTWVDIDEH